MKAKAADASLVAATYIGLTAQQQRVKPAAT